MAQGQQGTESTAVPQNLRVCVVDDDKLCLKIVSRMLQRCNYEVVTQTRATDALALLRAERNQFDLVLSDVYMPDMDGLKLLELIALELDLPVIMMSASSDASVVVQGISHGAVDYLLKPVRIEELRNIWQHTVRRELNAYGTIAPNRGSSDDDSAYMPSLSDQHVHDSKSTGCSTHSGGDAPPTAEEHSNAAHSNGDTAIHDHQYGNNGTGTATNSKRSSAGKQGGGKGSRRNRVVWSVELHQLFVNAVHELGVDKAVPKRVLEKMGVQGLTRENVASHLQKYRLYLNRLHEDGKTGQEPQEDTFQNRTGKRFEPTEVARAPTHQEVVAAKQQQQQIAQGMDIASKPSEAAMPTSDLSTNATHQENLFKTYGTTGGEGKPPPCETDYIQQHTKQDVTATAVPGTDNVMTHHPQQHQHPQELMASAPVTMTQTAANADGDAKMEPQLGAASPTSTEPPPPVPMDAAEPMPSPDMAIDNTIGMNGAQLPISPVQTDAGPSTSLDSEAGTTPSAQAEVVDSMPPVLEADERTGQSPTELRIMSSWPYCTSSDFGFGMHCL